MPGINPHSSGSTANVVIPASSLRRTSSSCSLPIAEQPVSLAETPLEDGWECLRYLRVSAISSTVVPSSERSQLAELDREPHIPLDNNVHRLFKRRRWPSLTDKEYDLLLPSLTIATKFMEQPQLLEFWKHIYLGALEYDGTKGHYLALTKYESSQHADKAIRSVFDVYLPEQLKFGFYDLDPLGNKIDGLSFGSEERYRLFCACYQLGPPDLIFCHPHIVLHIHYLYDLKYLVEYGTEDEMRDVFLRIAITLCHELAHIVWKYRIQGDFIQT
ncbi:hypothetical protein BDW02DRAFT_230816 [Decorospora gaudefroyi]|uniref:Uncharacterized protein n=1 Tax=Decorospora gaudefroyi TaxID=184978 RepID=A0A6A5KZ99_9PLEO|nr:hypothetical protein BDW02DRAFT_230816 [Decorospora gaudefroyi]